MSIADIERDLRKPAPVAPAPAHAAAAAPAAPAHAPPPPPPPAPAPAKPVVGQSMGMKARDPLALINAVGAPMLSEPRGAAPDNAMTPLVRLARGNERTVWYRVSGGRGRAAMRALFGAGWSGGGAGQVGRQAGGAPTCLLLDCALRQAACNARSAVREIGRPTKQLCWLGHTGVLSTPCPGSPAFPPPVHRPV